MSADARLREAALTLFDPMDHGSPSRPAEGHTVESLCAACVSVRSKRTAAIRRALVALGAMPAVGFRAALGSPEPAPTCVDCGGDHPSGHPWHTSPAQAEPAPTAGLDVDLDTLDHWQERAQEMSLDIVRLGDRVYTKRDAVALLDDLHLRLSRLAGDLWSAGHRNIGGRWVPPTRYMRDMAAARLAAAPPTPSEGREPGGAGT
jgi:hypothetical protein